MFILFVLTLTLLYNVVLSNGKHIASCSSQKDCLHITYNPIKISQHPHLRSTVVNQSNEFCHFEVCLQLNHGGSCQKHFTESIDHVCTNAHENFSQNLSFQDLFTDNYDQRSSEHSHIECQIVEGGSNAVFSLYDGDGCEGSESMVFYGALETTCEPRPEDAITCASDKVEGVDCIWTIKMPRCSRSLSETPNGDITLVSSSPPSFSPTRVQSNIDVRIQSTSAVNESNTEEAPSHYPTPDWTTASQNTSDFQPAICQMLPICNNNFRLEVLAVMMIVLFVAVPMIILLVFFI